MNLWRVTKGLVGLALALGLLWLLVWYVKSLIPSTTRISTAIGTVERGTMIQRVNIAGTLVPQRRSLIAAPYAGYVKSIYVKTGQRTKQGDPVISVSQSLQSLDPVFPLRAPFAGTVVQIPVSEGQFVKENDNRDYLVRIDDLGKLFVKGAAPEMERAKISVGLNALIKFTALGEKNYHGIIRDLALSAMESDGWSGSQVQFPLTIEVVDADKDLLPGLTAIVDIVTLQRENTLMLRHEFVAKRQGKYFVTREDGTRQEITVGIQNEESFEILSGLAENDRIQQVDFNALAKTK